MKTKEHLERIAYRAGVPKPIFTVIPGPDTVIRWREGGHYRDLIVDESLSDLEIEAEISRKLKLGLTTSLPR
jgi:hypothetical protein